MAHTKLLYSRTAIDRAGKFLAAPDGDAKKLEDAIAVLNNWRSFHGFPLNTISVDLRQKVQRVQQGVSPVRRLKRTRSVISKISKESMRLTQMQDVGGCRAVLHDIESVYNVKNLYEQGKAQHKPVAIADYIRAPKTSGYRSLHLIFRFQSRGNPEYNGLLIEVQLRTAIQHAWATAVETVAAVSGQALNSSEGEADWLDYFRYDSLALEKIENPFFSTITPYSAGEIARKLLMLGRKLHVEKKLTAFREALRATDKTSINNAAYYLMVLLPEGPQLQIFAYSRQNAGQAFEDYERYERLLPMYPSREQLPLFPELENYSGAQAVLVGAKSFKSVRESYPNYYLDTKIFIEHVESFVKIYRKSP
ncbi:RelA/SpoT domain-containing protein [Xanthomonas translucens]|uniref:RelA/SpoT domain-containing protein n=1 Tax=Xanthomonas translucens pv. translucens TaxID=134875 RepID=A0ABW9KW16_XANCT|nr:RelA/SpoT domain-containing protein [Xanthomonas translucens]QSQ33168.1 RelA/SpoT domain-containing protein [Xanthomonas translucens pv. translucens]